MLTKLSINLTHLYVSLNYFKEITSVSVYVFFEPEA